MPDETPMPEQPQATPNVDGVTSAEPAPQAAAPSAQPVMTSMPSASAAPRTKRALLSFSILCYGAYALWSMGLLAILPTTDKTIKALVPVGVLVALAGAVVFLILGWLLFRRIGKSDVSVRTKQRSLIKMVAFILPGLLLSAAVPLMITREPALWMDVVDPVDPQNLVAPLSVTFSVEKAKAILEEMDMKPVSYTWDTDGDGQPNDQTVVPTASAVYDRAGQYIVRAVVRMADGATRSISHRLVIPSAVFSITPFKAVVERPLRFSVAGLLSDPKDLKEVKWDFDGDGTPDTVSAETDTAHTYYATGPVTAVATVTLQNNAQATYRRTINIETPPPLPFPVTLTTEPQNLLGPIPFGVSFKLQTSEPVRDIQWVYGDGKEDRGANLLRVAHLYNDPGYYTAYARVRSQTGKLSELSVIVHATPVLNLPDLTYDGEPEVRDNRIRGEVPLAVHLVPRTSIPLIQFSWEDYNEGVPRTSTSATLDRVYRREGTFDVWVIAQDPEGKAFRQRIQVEATSPAATASFVMKPESGVAPLDVTFDASDTYVPPGEQIAGFKWLFGDEGQNASPELGVSKVNHRYTDAGEYKVVLKVVMASGKEFEAEKTLIVREPSISACMTASRTKVALGGSSKAVEFDSSCSTGHPVRYLWDVRNNAAPDAPAGQSTEPAYVHVFSVPGTYTVALTATDGGGRSDTKTTLITVTP